MSSSAKISKQKLIQDLKLNALLEVTKAINNNYSTPQLLDLYQDILENRLGVGKLVLFHYNKEWTVILKYGISKDFNHIRMEDELLNITDIQTITFSNGELSKSFEIVIPVFHKKKALAYVLLGDVNQQKREVSAAIKHLNYVQTLTNIIVVAIENKLLYREHIQRAQLTKELELAQSMQQMLFPSQLPNSELLQVAAKYLPHTSVGGDYYDFIRLNNHEFIFCVADVSGKGIAAALLMSNIQATLHSLINYTHNLKDITIELNKRVIDNTKTEKFVSLFIAKLNTKSQQFSYINAGHNPPILYHEGKYRELSKGCTILGINQSLKIEPESFDFSSGFTLLCYTDGLTDISNGSDALSVEKLKDIMHRHRDADPEELISLVLKYAEEFKGEQDFPDDIALMTIRVNDRD